MLVTHDITEFFWFTWMGRPFAFLGWTFFMTSFCCKYMASPPIGPSLNEWFVMLAHISTFTATSTYDWWNLVAMRRGSPFTSDHLSCFSLFFYFTTGTWRLCLGYLSWAFYLSSLDRIMVFGLVFRILLYNDMMGLMSRRRGSDGKWGGMYTRWDICRTCWWITYCSMFRIVSGYRTR